MILLTHHGAIHISKAQTEGDIQLRSAELADLDEIAEHFEDGPELDRSFPGLHYMMEVSAKDFAETLEVLCEEIDYDSVLETVDLDSDHFFSVMAAWSMEMKRAVPEDRRQLYDRQTLKELTTVSFDEVIPWILPHFFSKSLGEQRAAASAARKFTESVYPKYRFFAPYYYHLVLHGGDQAKQYALRGLWDLRYHIPICWMPTILNIAETAEKDYLRKDAAELIRDWEKALREVE